MSVKIFVVESNDRIRELIKEHISVQKSMELLSEAGDGEEALKIFEKDRFDVILLDLNISEQKSLEVLNNIIEIDPTPIIVVSAVNPEEMDSSMQALLLGAFDYIVKPEKLTQPAIKDFTKTLTKKINLASQSQLRRIIKQEDKSKNTTSLRQSVIDEIFEFGRQINKGNMNHGNIKESAQSFYRQKEIDKLFDYATGKSINDNSKAKIDKIKKETIQSPPSLRQRNVNEIFKKAKNKAITAEKNQSIISSADIKKSPPILTNERLSELIIKKEKSSDLKVEKYLKRVNKSDLQETNLKVERIKSRKTEFRETEQ
ncbi:MAG: response regulator, partial [Candidatus Lokiarchaeota archaeon]|nr:response regulator [Candidatus Lokiarchaeota archaeon]